MNIKLFKVLTKISLLSAIVLATAVVSAQAQSRIRVNIPFDFTIGNKKLPAGKYSVGRAQNSDDTVLSIRDEDGRFNAMRISIPVLAREAKSRKTLIFHRYGDQYFLYQVWQAGEKTGRQFVRSSTEREIERRLAANPSLRKTAENMQVETVTVVGDLE